jgi:hypothetical protein
MAGNNKPSGNSGQQHLLSLSVFALPSFNFGAATLRPRRFMMGEVFFRLWRSAIKYQQQRSPPQAQRAQREHRENTEKRPIESEMTDFKLQISKSLFDSETTDFKLQM